MGTAIGRVIDALVTGLSAPLQAIDDQVIVFDNWPDKKATSWVVIGHQDYDDGQAADVDVEWAELGAQRITETFTVPCFIDVSRRGPGQKPARDAAIALYDGVTKFIRTDPTLGVLERGRVAIASHLQLRQTEDADDTGAGGLRRAYLSFLLRCQNSYIP